jgi:electron transport complex protein RnfA
MLAVFSGLSMNLILQFGLGLKEIAQAENTFDTHIDIKELSIASMILFATVILLWLFLLFIRSFLFLGLVEYVLLFPASSLVFSLLENFTDSFILKQTKKHDMIADGVLSGGAPAAVALFVTLNVAGNLFEVVVLALGFSCGMALAVVVADEIRRRSQMEMVPYWLRGSPLVVIALGLLSLAFSSGALMLFRVLGA